MIEEKLEDNTETRDMECEIECKFEKEMYEFIEKERMRGKTDNEELLLILLRNTLEQYGIEYRCDYSALKKKIIATFSINDKNISLEMLVRGKDILCFTYEYPFRIRCNSIPLVSMFINEINNEEALCNINLDINSGRLTIKYETVCKDVDYFDDVAIWTYISVIIRLSQELYIRLNNLSEGKSINEIKDMYSHILKGALSILEGKNDEGNSIEYGANNYRKYSLNEYRQNIDYVEAAKALVENVGYGNLFKEFRDAENAKENN